MYVGLVLFSATPFLASVAASQLAGTHVVHEQRIGPPQGWTRRPFHHASGVLHMKIGLSQQNLHHADGWLMEVSHPASAQYGNHWTAKEVAKAFAPSTETVDAVKSWLNISGIDLTRVKHSHSLGWLSFDASVAEAENLLKTKYHVYEHVFSDRRTIACEQYHIPAELERAVDIITPTVHFDVHPSQNNAPRRRVERVRRHVEPAHSLPWTSIIPRNRPHQKKLKIITKLEDCYKQIIPECLRALYKFPMGHSATPNNSYGIVEYTPEAYIPNDMDLFFEKFNPEMVGQRPILVSIDGGYNQQAMKSEVNNIESNSDLQYAMTLVYPQNVTLYEVGDIQMGASFSDFLDALDGTFCVYDDRDQDGIYPDVHCNSTMQNYTSKDLQHLNATSLPLCYLGPKDCGGFPAAKVISTSYSLSEHDITPKYAWRQCLEYLKLGLMGTSFLFASGDHGVAGTFRHCINGTGPDAPYGNSSAGGRFSPGFPSSCPYVTSIGGTEVKNHTNILVAENPEVACEKVIKTGGGFSNVFPLPNYQAESMGYYFDNYCPPYSAKQYNNSQQVRGYPDLSANAAHVVSAISGVFAEEYGTSSSAPLVGAILTLINEERYISGKSSIGFINPVAYAFPWMFKDITEGHNPGCNTSGFAAVPGWDPVTGLGTPRFPSMKEVFLSLPSGNGVGWQQAQKESISKPRRRTP